MPVPESCATAVPPGLADTVSDADFAPRPEGANRTVIWRLAFPSASVCLPHPSAVT